MIKSLSPYLRGLIEGETNYAEPFVGGGSVALSVAALDPNIRLHLNDLDDLVAAVWTVVSGSRDQVEDLAQRLEATKPTVALWDEVKASQPQDLVGKAFKCIFLNKTSFNGQLDFSSPIGGREQQGKAGGKGVWLIDCQFTPSTLRRLLFKNHALLSGRTTVSQQHFRDFLPSKRDMALFLDPPYFPSAKTNKLYRVQMGMPEHEELAALMHASRKWIMTYDFSGDVAKRLYIQDDEDMVLLKVRYSSSSVSKSGTWKKDRELLAVKGLDTSKIFPKSA